jgi:hypothetical protein
MGRARVQRQELFVGLLRKNGIMQVVLLDVRDGQQSVLAVLAGRIGLNQELE